MQFGDEWGELWGDAVADIETHVDDGISRLVYALTCAPEFEKLLTIYLEKVQEIEHAIRGVSPSLLFDIPTAYGQQLNQIGNILGLPREGWSDELYRVYLRTMALLILPDRRTQRRLLEVIRSLMDTDAGIIEYVEFRPKTYLIAVAGVELGELISWLRFIELCRPATYIAQIIWTPDEPFGYDDSTGAVPTTVYPYADSTGALSVGGHYSAVISS